MRFYFFSLGYFRPIFLYSEPCCVFSAGCENGDRKFSIRNALKNLPHAEPAAQFTCPFFKDFDFDTVSAMLHIL